MEIHLSCGATKSNGDVWIPDQYFFGEKKSRLSAVKPV